MASKWDNLLGQRSGDGFQIYLAGGPTATGALDYLLPSDLGLKPSWKEGRHVILHENTAPGAHKLHQTDGFFVYDDDHLTDTTQQFAEDLDVATATDKDVEKGLEKLAKEQVGYYKEYTGGTRPAGYDPAGYFTSRPQRRGGWGDRSGLVADSYEVSVNGKKITNLPGPEGQNYYTLSFRW